MEYLTPNDYNIAASNGITKHNLEQRFYTYGWSRERARTQPLRNKISLYQQYKEICEQNGVHYKTFSARIAKLKWNPEKAASVSTKDGIARGIETRKQRHSYRLPAEKLAEAEQNGIPEQTVKNRVYVMQWPVQRAITEPIHIRNRWKKK